MAFDEIKLTLKEIKDMCKKMNRKPYIYLTGGDPILHPNFWDLLELLNRAENSFSVKRASRRNRKASKRAATTNR